MSANKNLKRLPLKYVRDKAKAGYVKDSECYVCATSENLEFHHMYTLDLLFEKWLRENGIKITSVDDVLEHREQFIEEHTFELYEYARTLCSDCHKHLHRIYGQKPSLLTAQKQERWLNKQREKKRA